jgi:putative ABC transport system substrate-binding protein
MLAGLGSAVVWSSGTQAQQTERVRRVGVLMGFSEGGPEDKPWISAFTQRLLELGWTGSRNVRMDFRWANGSDINRIRALAQELVSLQPDIIVAGGTPATVALQRETRTIPIVFANVTDPVASGLVAWLDRPSGNITGFPTFEAVARVALGDRAQPQPGRYHVQS